MPVSFAARSALRLALGMAASGALCPAANAQATSPAERLSQWLLRQPPMADADPLAMAWYSVDEVPAQVARQKALVHALQQTAPALAELVATLPATGRVPLTETDPRALQLRPRQDPLLASGDRVVLPRRSEWVGVITPSGYLCLATFYPGAAAQTYLQACGQTGQHDTAWLVQPDGQVSTLGLQPWNEQTQAAPAPGAWLWAPARHSGVSDATSGELARFLATQGAAPGAAQTRILERQEPLPLSIQAAASLRDLPVTTNDWGVYGLWQTPTARLGKAGEVAFTYFRADPYSNITLQLQPFDWLSGAVRYTDVMTRRYGSFAFSGDQSYKDKSVDIKLRLWEESHWLPQLAVGWRDLLGTGLFSGEYVVANKRHGDFDVSLGMGWGYVGRRGNIRNPLGRLSSGFDTRPNTRTGSGGNFTPRAYFRGPAALFGGVQYHTPWDGVVIKAEYEGNDYKHEPFGDDLRARSPLNVGVVWRWRPWLDLSLAWERGQQLGFGLSAHTDLDGMNTQKVLDPPRLPVQRQRPAVAGDPALTARDITTQTGLNIAAIGPQQGTWTATVQNPSMGYAAPMMDRALAVLHRDAPPNADRLAVRIEQRGTDLALLEVDRDRWAQDQTQPLPPSLKPPAPQFVTPPREAPTPAVQPERGAFSWGIGVSLRQNLGGPNAFVLYALSADLNAEWRVRRDTWFTGTYNLRVLDNYDKFKANAPTGLPPVRTLLRQYMTTSRDTLPNLQLTHMGQLGRNHFYLAYAGLLESMYAGAGAEYLYRPTRSRFAVGLDVNSVQQRGFEQKFEMRDYRVNTGHLTAYWDTGFQGLFVNASVGRYLAKDRGVTLNISRNFDNGVAIGAYASKTSATAQQFGEGSFDKGVYLSIPFDAMLPRSGPSSATIVYAPLIRDGGAKLGRRYQLYNLTYLRSPTAMTIGQ